MSDQIVSDQKTIETPVSPEDLNRFSQLASARLQICERLCDLEQEKIRVLRAVANVDSERQKLFEKVLVERGLPPGFPVEIDSKTGQIKAVEGVELPRPSAQVTPEAAPEGVPVEVSAAL